MKAIEIERKFLVLDDRWRKDAGRPHLLEQAYFSKCDQSSVRVRLVDGRSGFLTIKFRMMRLIKEEYEYDIPALEARELIDRASGRVVRKARYPVFHEGRQWDVDVFAGAYEGLTLAEIEMASQDDCPSLPQWLGREVTGDPRYSNSVMAEALRALAIPYDIADPAR